MIVVTIIFVYALTFPRIHSRKENMRNFIVFASVCGCDEWIHWLSLVMRHCYQPNVSAILNDLHQCHLLGVVQCTLRIMHIFCDILWYLIDRFYKNHSHRVHHHVMWLVLVTGSWRMWETIKHKSMVIKPVQINKCTDLYCQCLNSSTICAPDPLRCNVL